MQIPGHCIAFPLLLFFLLLSPTPHRAKGKEGLCSLTEDEQGWPRRCLVPHELDPRVERRHRGRTDASSRLMKARILPHLPLCPGLVSMYHSQERRENIVGFEGITGAKFNQL